MDEPPPIKWGRFLYIIETLRTFEDIHHPGNAALLQSERLRGVLSPLQYAVTLSRRYRGNTLFQTSRLFAGIVTLGGGRLITKTERRDLVAGSALAYRILRERLPNVTELPIPRTDIAELLVKLDRETAYALVNETLGAARSEFDDHPFMHDLLYEWFSRGAKDRLNLVQHGYGFMMHIARQVWDATPGLEELSLHADVGGIDWDQGLREL